jgi:membrane associated rhomboid family serine protease
MNNHNIYRGFKQLPPVTLNILIINALAYFAWFTFEKGFASQLLNWFALHDIRSNYFNIYQIITSTLLNTQFIYFLLSMLVFWMFGRVLEALWGPKRFLAFYFICSIVIVLIFLAALYFYNNHLLQNIKHQPSAILLKEQLLNTPYVGAPGILFAFAAAFAFLFPNQTFYVYFILPLKAKWAVLLFAGAELLFLFLGEESDKMAHLGNVAGGIIGFLLAWIWHRKKPNMFIRQH